MAYKGNPKNNVNCELSSYVSSGDGTIGWYVISNQLELDVTSATANSTKYLRWQLIAPEDYKKNALLKVNLSLEDITNSNVKVDAYINGVIDETINQYNITPSEVDSFEMKEASFSSAIAKGDIITIRLVIFHGDNGDWAAFRGLCFAYEY